ILRTTEDVAKAKSEIPAVALILESFVPFTRELSILAVRSRNGESAIYPLVENHHRSGILRLSIAPAPRLDANIQRAAESAARRAHLQLYRKTPRPGRKLGHVSLRAASPERLALRLSELPAFFHRPDFCLDAALVHSASLRT